MKDYSSYTVRDFVLDKGFQRWVMAPDDEIRYFWEDWLLKHPEKEEEVMEAKASIKALPFEHHPLSREEDMSMWMHISSRIMDIETDPQVESVTEKRPQLSQWYRYAAAFLLPVLVGLIYWNIISQDETFTTGYGEKRSITLPDGSRVTLNANSSLTLRNDWEEGQSREVWLEGEAFFEVEQVQIREGSAKETKVKFVVYTPQIAVEVLGTAFNVKNRQTSTEVVLNTGKIMLKKETDSLAMLPGEKVIVSKAYDRLSKTIVENPEIFSVWKKDSFAFNNASLQDVGAMLQEIYGYEVRIQSPEILQRKISSIAPASTRNIDVFLKMLEELYKVKVTKSHNVIQIEAK